MAEIVALPRGSPDVQGPVVGIEDSGAEPRYRVFLAPSEKPWYPERSLVSLNGAEDDSPDPTDPLGLMRAWALANAPELQTYLTLRKLRTPLAGNLLAFAASRTERLPYQFKPVLKLLDGPTGRLLVADEVGLGKTIEAGIVLSELRARGELDTALVACPSNLLVKWQRELQQRFDLEFTILDGPGWRTAIREIAEGRTPRWLIGSHELLRGSQNFDLLNELEPRFDVVIVDEAHHLRNRGTQTNRLGEALCERAENALFLTATPLNLRREDFFELLRLLLPDEFGDFDAAEQMIEPNAELNDALRALRRQWPPNHQNVLAALARVRRSTYGRRLAASARFRGLESRLKAAADGEPFDREAGMRAQLDLIALNTLAHVFTRTRKREVQEHFPMRRARTIRVELDPDEQLAYDAVEEWVAAEYAHLGPAVGFVLSMVQRQTISCLPAMVERLPELLRKRGIDLADDEVADDAAPLEAHVDAGRLAGSLGRLERDSKFERFVEALEGLLSEGTERVLVFAFFIRTIESLAERLTTRTIAGQRLRVLTLYGPMDREQRQEAVRQFQHAQGPTILLSSEVGSEGLDFQFCSAMVNYDLPWNPMRVEQRIGRIDRYGQEAEVIHVVNMVVDGTIEDRIFHRLYERIGIFTRSIGDLEAILGQEHHALEQLQQQALSRALTEAEEQVRVDQVANVILRRQHEDEEFDNESRRIVGMDDVFLDRFNDIKESRRYVTPEELRRLVELWLANRRPRSVLREVADGIFDLRFAVGDKDLGRDLLASGPETMEERHALRTFLARTLRSDPVPITFDAEQAVHDTALEFVSLHHPLIKGIVGHHERDAAMRSAGILAVPASRLAAASIFFVFELRERALRDRVEHVNVVVRIDGDIDPDATAQLPDLIADAGIPSTEVPPVAVATVDAAFATATRWLEHEVLERERALEQITAESVDARLASLELSFERFQGNVTRLAQEARDPRIRRLREGQLRNRELEYEARRRDLEGRRHVTIGDEVLAAGVLIPE